MVSQPPITSQPIGIPCVGRGILVVFAAFLAWSAWRHTPIASETAHLVAGISHLQLNRFDLLAVNPPLVRSLAAVPVVLLGPEIEWAKYDSNPLSRAEHYVGREFINFNGTRAFWLLAAARWMCIPFCVAGALACYFWARSAYGREAGLLALVLWCSSPFILGHGALVLCDAHAAAMSTVATFAFRRWLASPGWGVTWAAGILLGIAELCKTTLLVLYPVWLLVWLGSRLVAHSNRPPSLRREIGMILVFLAVSVLVINIGYGFDGSMSRLDSYHFHSAILSGVTPYAKAVEEGGNRFSGTWFGRIQIPLPTCYVKGIDKQKSDFDDRQTSFLAGKWQQGGWWHYYLYALAVKSPLGVLILGLLATVATLRWSAYRASFEDEGLLIGSMLSVLLLVSSQTGFSHHARYAIPALPFAFVWIAKAAGAITRRQRLFTILVLASGVWSVCSSLWVYPHSYSYFNEVVGGPAHGAEHLSESNVAWGQDLFFLKDWLDQHPEVQPLYVTDHAYFDLKILGIDGEEPPVDPMGMHAHQTTLERLGPKPGWYAINVCRLHEVAGDYAYLLQFQPVKRIGYSYCIYYLQLDEVNYVRRQMGLPELI